MKKDAGSVVVVTTVHGVNDVVMGWAESEHSLILVGDEKTPRDVRLESSDDLWLPLEHQTSALARALPRNHYARKNLGYVQAVKRRAEVVFDTDDDNAPLPNFQFPPMWRTQRCVSGPQFYNAYQAFTEARVWPRGFPLDLVRDMPEYSAREAESEVGVWQMLADGSPDVDAAWRLMDGRPIKFAQAQSFALDRGTYCPVNSQVTFWRRELFPLLYLPSTVSSRFCDILRGYVAQRVMWSLDAPLLVGWGGPIVRQDRNWHSLQRDFHDETFMYTHVHQLTEALGEVDYSGCGLDQKLWRAYKALVDARVVKFEELTALTEWLSDVSGWV